MHKKYLNLFILRITMNKTFIMAYKLLCFGILFLVALGASVRVMDAGLACPDWPLCFGQFIPDYHPQVYFEFLHRLLAGLISLVSFYLNIKLLKNKTTAKAIKTLIYFIFIILLAQIILGGLTVLMQLNAYVVVAHLSLGTGFLALSFWVYFLLNKKIIVDKFFLNNPHFKNTFSSLSVDLKNKLHNIQKIAVTNLFVVAVQIFLGGLVASHYAGLVCLDFPLCNGELIPTFKGIIGLQVIHRLGAYFTVCSVLFFVFKIKQIIKSPFTNYLFLFIFLQFGLGVANILFHTPPVLAVLHLVCGVSLFLFNLRLVFEIKNFK